MTIFFSKEIINFKSIQKDPIEIILPVHDIHVPSYFSTPSFDKIKRAAEYYDLHGHFMPIVVSFHYSRWYVRDGYTIYWLLKGLV